MNELAFNDGQLGRPVCPAPSAPGSFEQLRLALLAAYIRHRRPRQERNVVWEDVRRLALPHAREGCP
jgi:hypothetical protein